MIEFQLFNLLVDWTRIAFQLSIVTFEYPVPTDDVFRHDSLFSFGFDLEEGTLFLEVLFFVVIGEVS